MQAHDSHTGPRQPCRQRQRRRPTLGFLLIYLIHTDEIYDILVFIGPTKANEGQQQPTTANEGQCRPMLGFCLFI
jgi:hypothetical protein